MEMYPNASSDFGQHNYMCHWIMDIQPINLCGTLDLRKGKIKLLLGHKFRYWVDERDE